MKDGLPLVWAYGMGVNSTAGLIESRRRDIVPEVILAADTGGERPETYRTLAVVSEWCVKHGFPAIVTVKHHGGRITADESLEAECLRGNRLPSIAYGFKSCSDKWKRQPQKAYLKALGIHEYVKALGFDADEERRAKASPEKGVTNWFPLIEWGLYREDCVEICRSEGLPTAKSSCFFCPSMKKWEIVQLAQQHPDLAARAIAMERNAELTTIKGLGRDFSWGDFLKATAAQKEMFCDIAGPEIPCGCYDG